MPEILPTWYEVILWEWEILELISFEVIIGEKKKMFERARRPPGVRVIIVREWEILLSREYRREQGKYDYRLPWGKVMDSIREMRSFRWDILRLARSAAIKEAREETGVIIENPELIHISHCGANVEWDLYYYLATEFEETDKHERDDEGESDMTIAWYSFDEVKAMIMSDEMSEDRSIAVLLKWMMKEENLTQFLIW